MNVETKTSLTTRLLGPYHVLRGNRPLVLLFSGQVVSAFGDWLYITALIVLAYSLTHDAGVVAALTFVRLLPYALFLPLSGVLADRFNRKALMITADLGRCLCMVGLLAVTSRQRLPLAFPLVFVATCLFSLFRPALNAVLPAVAGDEENLVKANTLMSQIDGLSFVIGPSLAGVLILLGHIRAAFVINAATYLVSATTLFFLRIPPAQPTARPADGGWLTELLAGFRFLFRENEGVLAAATLTLAGLSVFGGAFWTLVVVLAVQTFHLGTQGTGFLNTAYGAGGLIGGFLVGPVVARLRVETGFIAATIASAVAATLVGLSPAGVLPFIFLATLGTIDVFAQIFGTTIVQTATPAELLGRVFGAFEATIIAAMLLGSLAAGPLIAALGPRAAAVALALLGVVVLLLCLTRLRRMEAALGVRIFLRRVPLLAALPRAMLDDLAPLMSLESVADGTAIVRQGEHGDRLFIVKSGEVQVRARRDGQGEVDLATLSAMDYFGEIALLRDVPRTATVVARGGVQLYSLTRANFADLLARSEDLRAALSGTGDARYVDTQSKLLMRR